MTAENLPAPSEDASWANDAVFLRVPSGTDPLAALREAMGVFMERTDGTNAMPWWLRVRWWHGGATGLKQGDMLLPPSETGIMPALEVTDRRSVYITTNQNIAILFAARFKHPALYEVTIDMEPARDDVVPDDASSWRVPRAKVWRRLGIPASNLAMSRLALEYRPPDADRPAD